MNKKRAKESNPEQRSKATKSQTICWDCANACGRCSWSQKFRPVKGWLAEEAALRTYKNGWVVQATYTVKWCPMFRRDAKQYGLTRV